MVASTLRVLDASRPTVREKTGPVRTVGYVTTRAGRVKGKIRKSGIVHNLRIASTIYKDPASEGTHLVASRAEKGHHKSRARATRSRAVQEQTPSEEAQLMRMKNRGLWALGLTLLTAAAAGAAAPKLDLTDGKYPLWEIRPLDRRVYVVSLDGKWKREWNRGANYQLVVRFPNGTTYSHRPINDELFALGEMRFMVPEYLLLRTGTAKGGKVKLYVTEQPSAGAKTEVISNELELTWPLERPIGRRAPATKYTPMPPIDAFPEEEAPLRKKIEEAPPVKKKIQKSPVKEKD
jgi:hypothetical protein